MPAVVVVVDGSSAQRIAGALLRRATTTNHRRKSRSLSLSLSFETSAVPPSGVYCGLSRWFWLFTAGGFLP